MALTKPTKPFFLNFPDIVSRSHLERVGLHDICLHAYFPSISRAMSILESRYTIG
jgi:hypothetical protein